MKKSTIFEWFVPVAVLVYYLPAAVNIMELETKLPSFLNFMLECVAAIMWAPVYWLIQLSETTSGFFYVLLAIIIIIMLFVPAIYAIHCVIFTVDYVTRDMGDSHGERDAGYYNVTLDDDTLYVDRATNEYLTGAGWVRLLMFFTYLLWFIPVFIVQYKKEKARKKTKND